MVMVMIMKMEADREKWHVLSRIGNRKLRCAAWTVDKDGIIINLQHLFSQNLESEVERNDEEVGDQEQNVRYTQAGQQPVEQIVHGPELKQG